MRDDTELEAFLDLFERDGDDYLVQVYSTLTKGYEWMPVTEEMVELIDILWRQLNEPEDD